MKVREVHSTSVAAISVQQLAETLQETSPPLLIDCREANEWGFCRIEGAQHIPMSEIRTRYQELTPTERIVVYCHHGMRSQAVAEFLTRQQFSQVANLVGGIDAWSLHVDPQVPRY